MSMIDFRNVVYDICSGLGIDVYDYWPTNASFPYIITQTIQSIDDNAKNVDYGEYIFDIHIFDKYSGNKTVIDYAEQVKTALYAATIADVDRRCSYLVINDKEPDVAHAIVTIRFKY